MTRGDGERRVLPGSIPVDVSQVAGRGFSVHKEHINQTGMPSGAYAPVAWSAKDFDTGDWFDLDSGRWVPNFAVPVLVQFSYQLWWVSGAATVGNPAFVAKLIRNGQADVKAVIGNVMVGWAAGGLAIVSGSFAAVVYPDDTFRLDAFGLSWNGGSVLTLDGNPAHTWWTGASVGAAA